MNSFFADFLFPYKKNISAGYVLWELLLSVFSDKKTILPKKGRSNPVNL